MITINFYNFQKAKNSTKIPEGTGTAITGNIEEPFGVERLTISLKVKRTDATPAAVSVPSFNYAYISNFSRYYFAGNWRFDAGFFYVDLSADPLASYKTYIGNTSQYILRSSETYSDESIVDNLAVSKAGKKITIKPFEGFSSTPELPYVWSKFGGTIPGTAGRIYQNVVMILNIERIKYTDASQPSYPHDAFVILQTDYDQFTKFVNTISNRYGTDYAVKAVAAAYFCPIVFKNFAYDRNRFAPVDGVYLANLSKFDEWTGDTYVEISGYRALEQKTIATFSAEIPSRPSGNNKVWQYTAAARSYMVCGQPFGSTKIESDLLADNKFLNGLILTFEMDNFSGSAKVLLTPVFNGQVSTARKDMYFTTVNLYANLPYASSGVTNVWEKNMTYISAPVQVFNSAAAGVRAGTGGGVPGMIAGGIIGGVVGTAGAVVGIASAEQKNIERSINCGDITMGDHAPYLEIDDTLFTESPYQTHGAPFCKFSQINTKPGFIMCENPKIETSGNMTISEAEQIAGYMTNGFYFE